MRIAIVLPCYNEELTIADTIAGFRKHLPQAEIWVCDNNSKDNTAKFALEAGARVVFEPLPGKGNAVRRLFADVDADVYIMSDGDTTYDPAIAPRLVDELLTKHCDMVVGRRVSSAAAAYRAGHVLGNRVFSALASWLFGFKILDIFSGYRVFSRRFVKTFPSVSEKFEIETEMNVHAIDQRLPTREIDTDYLPRPEGSNSKLSTYVDGMRILLAILRLLRDTRPFQFFGLIASGLLLISIVLAIPLVYDYFTLHLIPRIPTAILVTGMSVVSFVVFTTGVILDALRVVRHNQFRNAYLAQDVSYYHVANGPRLSVAVGQ